MPTNDFEPGEGRKPRAVALRHLNIYFPELATMWLSWLFGVQVLVLVQLIAVPVFLSLRWDPLVQKGSKEVRNANAQHEFVFSLLVLLTVYCYLRTRYKHPGHAKDWVTVRPDVSLYRTDDAEQNMTERDMDVGHFDRKCLADCENSRRGEANDRHLFTDGFLDPSREIISTRDSFSFSDQNTGEDEAPCLGDTFSKWRYCSSCEQPKPPRVSHCSKCEECILRYDHHCIWTGNCIGQLNVKVFILFLLYATVGCIQAIFLLLRFLLHCQDVTDYARYRMVLPTVLIAPLSLSVALAVCGGVGGLLFWQLYLATKNMTSLEYYRMWTDAYENTHDDATSRRARVISKYDQGLRRNLAQVMGPRPWLWLVPIVEDRAVDVCDKPAKHTV